MDNKERFTRSKMQRGSRVDDDKWYNQPEFDHFWRCYSRSMEFSHCNLITNQQTVYEQWCQAMVEYHTQWAEYMNKCSLYYSSHIPRIYGSGFISHKNVNSNFDDEIFVRPGAPPSKAASQPSQDGSHQEIETTLSKTNRRKRRSRKQNKPSPSRNKKAKKGQLFSDLEDIPSDFEVVLDLSSDVDCQNKLDAEQGEYQMEISEDMLAFFAHSAKHKQERAKAQKNVDDEQKREVEEEHMDLAFVSAHRQNPASVLPPTERPGARRTSEMTAIYGDGAPMIHAMETALQLTYNRNCDRNQAKPWPQLPLNIKFD